jgi:hypothetical protein
MLSLAQLRWKVRASWLLAAASPPQNVPREGVGHAGSATDEMKLNTTHVAERETCLKSVNIPICLESSGEAKKTN